MRLMTVCPHPLGLLYVRRQIFAEAHSLPFEVNEFVGGPLVEWPKDCQARREILIGNPTPWN
ncbi:hypothetical protein BU23DRAFT_561674 [Bimuria novae-zelandiae CBS 107.79]|uniref:Uncharacterized protein n=1 Tax=Bimuria novae-zelandiae CBS 107.79 TaxID=1447943 RepID=A0A6A5UUE4_9PLEO|nr:hypothetical protein BU23DRAFT_561674 [Bimuria novae-zelandiae CBS 107.79]